MYYTFPAYIGVLVLFIIFKDVQLVLWGVAKEVESVKVIPNTERVAFVIKGHNHGDQDCLSHAKKIAALEGKAANIGIVG